MTVSKSVHAVNPGERVALNPFCNICNCENLNTGWMKCSQDSNGAMTFEHNSQTVKKIAVPPFETSSTSWNLETSSFSVYTGKTLNKYLLWDPINKINIVNEKKTQSSDKYYYYNIVNITRSK